MKIEELQRCNACFSTILEIVDAGCNITRCQECGYVFDNPRPTLDELIGFYSRPTQYDSWLQELEARELMWKRRLNALRDTRKPGSLLDVGTGIGQFLALARDYYSEVHGTEVSAAAIQLARERYHLDIFQGTIEELRLYGKVFDNITLFHVLEHAPDPRSMLDTCHSLLRPQGILVIAVPNEISSLRRYVRQLLVRSGLKHSTRLGEFGLPRLSLEQDSVEVHLSHFTARVLRQLLLATGFLIEKETLDPYYATTGFAKFKADGYYYSCLAFRNIFAVNIYDAMLFIARKETN